MASEVQDKLKKIKSKSPKLLTEKYREVFDRLVEGERNPQRLQEGVEAFLSAGTTQSPHTVVAGVIDIPFLAPP